MGFYDEEKNVISYIKMADGYDGKYLIENLKCYLKSGSSVLEIGMGPGKDLDILKKYYKTTGSDVSKIFIDIYLKDNPDADLLLLDAITIDTERKFDAIYSNKVLQHLEKKDLIKSLKRQKDVVSKNGIMLHSFWKGEGIEQFEGLLFCKYKEKDLQRMIEPFFEILKIEMYTEMEKDDSIFIIMKNIL